MSGSIDLPRQDKARETRLGQVDRFFAGRVSTTDDSQGLLAEDGNGSIADGARRDAGLPVRVFSGEVHATSGSTGRDDERVTSLGFLILGVFAPEFEGSRRKVCDCDESAWQRAACRLTKDPTRLTNFRDRFRVDRSAEAERLSAEEVHHLGTSDTLWEPGTVAK